MINHIFKSPYKGSLNIFVFGDMQWGVQGFQEEAWQQFEHEFKTTENAVAIGMGDYIDHFRPTMRDKLYKSTDDSTRLTIEKMFLNEHDKLLNKMSFLEGKLIGIHNGHHCFEFMNGTNSDQRVASALKTSYLGWISRNRLVIPDRHKNREKSPCFIYTILSMHGQANARKTGGAISWLEGNYLQSEIVDQYIMGHNCKSATWSPNERNVCRRTGPAGVIKQLPRLMNVGGFCKGYTDGWQTSWIERMGFSEQPVGWGVIRLNIKAAPEGNTKDLPKGSNYLDVEQVSRHQVYDYSENYSSDERAFSSSSQKIP